MTQNPPTQSAQPQRPGQPGPAPGILARPAVVPTLPTRIRQPGRQAPLPDAVAVRRLAVPDPAPPYDDEVPARAAVDGEGIYHGKEVIAAPAASATDAAEPADQQRPDPGPASDGSHGPGPGAPSGRPSRPDQAGAWPSQFAQVLAETLAGSRPPQQLTPWTTEQARKRIRELGPMLATDQRPRVRRVITSAPAAGVLELTAVVGFGPRVRALALRLEREQGRPYRQGGGWCCTAIESA